MRKLSDSIQQIGQSPEVEALVCDAVSHADAWVHLSKGSSIAGTTGDTAHSVWILMIGYPRVEHPLSVLQSLGCRLPQASQLLDWEQGIYARVSLPSTMSSSEIAGIIDQIMRGVHGVLASGDVEVALESQQ